MNGPGSTLRLAVLSALLLALTRGCSSPTDEIDSDPEVFLWTYQFSLEYRTNLVPEKDGDVECGFQKQIELVVTHFPLLSPLELTVFTV
ncbi:hypothetical protein F2P81_011544 [Scophthalmus maximus]|uniref:Uncharacterized protein n=1 Tax=Scophthalmus maximus TaxID=52904 RepID=A0A6A4T1X5_SCOMX|nr:hypothetical protein F2P81_011544 [Scophthalmus maximus]